MLATAYQHIDLVRLLLTSGADASIKDAVGNTALKIAEMKGFKEILVLLEEWTRR